MISFKSSELEAMCKKPQTRKITIKCQKNQEADSTINEGKRHSKVKIHETKPDSSALGFACSQVSIFFPSSFSVSLLGLLLAYSLTLKTPFSWLPMWIMALKSSVFTDGEEILTYSSSSLGRTFNSTLIINPSTGRSQKQSFRCCSCVTGCLQQLVTSVTH